MSYVFDLIHNVKLTDGTDYFQNGPLSRYSCAPSAYSQMNVPFALTFTTFHPDTDTPFLSTILSPGYAFYAAIDSNDFEYAKAYCQMHQHDRFELIYVIDGDFYQCIERTRHKYIPNSCCMLNPFVFHSEDYTSYCRIAVLSLSSEFLHTLFLQKNAKYFDVELHPKASSLQQFILKNLSSDALSGKNYIDFIPREDANLIAGNIHHIFDALTHQILFPYPGSSLMIQALICRVFYLLDSTEYFHTDPISLGTPTEATLFSAISKRMEEAHGRITRKELMQEFRYSGTYLNDIVKKFTGLSIFQYGITFTMQEAARLLIDTNLSVSEITIELSFSDRTHFYRLFHKTYGMTPKEYRKAHAGTPKIPHR